MVGEKEVADREGFEPSIQLPVCVLSRDVVSATHPPVQFSKSEIVHNKE